MVLSMSECPNHCCTVRRSTPCHKHCVANDARNLCSQKLSGSSLARFATALRQSRKSSLGLHPAVGNTRAQPLDAFDFHAFKLFASFVGMGISRSLYAFGVHPLSGLWLTRTVDAAKLTSVQYVNITSCSRSPVIKKLIPEPFFRATGRKELVQFGRFVYFRLFLREAGPIVLAH